MKKIILGILLGTITLMSCNDESTEKDKSVVAEEVKKEEVPATDPIEEDNLVGFENLPEGWIVEEMMEKNYLYIHDSIHYSEMASLSDHYAIGFGEIYGHIVSNGLQLAGSPMCIWKTYDTTAYSYLNIAMPIVESDTGNDVIKAGTIRAGVGLKYVHFGDYNDMSEPHITINEWATESNMNLDSPMEIYLNDGGMESDTAKWETEIWYPVL